MTRPQEHKRGHSRVCVIVSPGSASATTQYGDPSPPNLIASERLAAFGEVYDRHADAVYAWLLGPSR